jgi:replicative DNA helicase
MNDVPHSTEAEIGVLGAMLIDPEAVSEVRVVLTPADFYGARHRLLYEAMVSLHDKGSGVDVTSLGAHLKAHGNLDGAGGWDMLGALVDAVPTAAGAYHHAAIVRDTAALRRLITACQETARDAMAGADTAEVFQAAERRLLAVTDRSGPASFCSAGDLVLDAMALIERASNTPDGMVGIRTGIPHLDHLTAGLEAGCLTILAGRPAMGKSALAWQLAERAAMDDHGVAYASYEMGRGQLGRRGLARLTGIDAGAIRRGRLDQPQWAKLSQAANRLGTLPLWTCDRPPSQVEGLRSLVQRHRTKHEVSLLVVDYLQQMAGPKNAGNRNNEVEHITRNLKRIASELGVHVLALSQLSRKVEDRKPPRPMLADLRDSGAIEQDADNVLLLWRPEEYFDDATPDETRAQWQGKGELILAKQRDGATGRVLLSWDAARLMFTEAVRDGFGLRKVGA